MNDNPYAAPQSLRPNKSYARVWNKLLEAAGWLLVGFVVAAGAPTFAMASIYETESPPAPAIVLWLVVQAFWFLLLSVGAAFLFEVWLG